MAIINCRRRKLLLVGPKKQEFWPKINIFKGRFFLKNLSMNYGSSKRAKVVLSKSIFYDKYQPIFFKKNASKNFNLGDNFLLKTFFLDSTLLKLCLIFDELTFLVGFFFKFFLRSLNWWKYTACFQTRKKIPKIQVQIDRRWVSSSVWYIFKPSFDIQI